MAMSKPKKVSKKKTVRLRSGQRVPSKRDPKSKREKGKRNIVRGKEISIRESASERQVVYGRFRVGGVTTCVVTNQDSVASLVTGSSNSQIAWVAKTPGEAGNNITITIVVPPSNGTLTVGVIGNAITVTCRSSSSTSLSTANQIISLVRGTPAANALVAVHPNDGDGTGIVNAVSTTALQNGGGTRLHQMVTLSGHDIDAIEKLYLDDREVVFGAPWDSRWGSGVWLGKVFMAVQYGLEDQLAQPDFIAQIPTVWTSDHRQRSCGGAYIILVWDQNLFPEGFPEISFLMRGKPCYDPRTTTVYWTQNAALCILDLLRNSRYGWGIPLADIDTASFIAAADICEEQVTLADASTENRYKINGAFDTSESRDDILEQMLQACAGDIVVRNGKWSLYVGAYRAPTYTLTEDDLRGPISISTHVSRSTSFNCIRGTYISPEDNYNETDLPAQKNATYVSQDGGVEIYQDIALNFVTSNTQGQRLLKIELEKNRQGITVRWPGKITCLKLQDGDTVNISLPQYGWNPKIFEVQEFVFIVEEDGTIGIDLFLRETASGVFDWNSGEQTEIDLAPNTAFPTALTVEPPENVTLSSGTSELFVRNDGTVISRLKVSWDNSATEFVQFGGAYEIQYKLSADTDWSQSFTVPGYVTFHHILDVDDGVMYDVRIRGVNTLNFASDWVEVLNHTVIGKTAPPSNVIGFSATKQPFGIGFQWQAITDLDKDEYEIRIGLDYDSGQFLWRGKSTTTTYNFQMAGTYTVWIKAYDTSGNPSTNATAVSFTINQPSAPTVSGIVSGGELFLNWNEPFSDFAIEQFEIRYGASFNTGVAVGIITGHDFVLTVNWGGVRTFWIAAKDVGGNLGAAGSATITINDPNPVQNFTATVIKNNVLLDWGNPAVGDLPIQNYNVYKGDTFALAAKIGTVYGTFHTYIERLGGTFTYWVEAVDTAGNISSEAYAIGIVSAPQDFFILTEEELLPDFLESSALCVFGGTPYAEEEDPTHVWLPVDITDALGTALPIVFSTGLQTWDDWWTSNGWTTWQDAINQGFDQYLQPSPAAQIGIPIMFSREGFRNGFIEFVVDIGVSVDSGFIDFSWTKAILGEDLPLSPSIAVSLDGITYSATSMTQQLFAEDFRYIKLRIDFTTTNPFALIRLQDFLVNVTLQTVEEFGQAAVLAADSGGTTVPFTISFADVDDIQLTALGTTFASPVLNFTDTPNPPSFKILLFDEDGNRINGNVGYRVRGALSSV